ncbi:MAG: hypothetical protein V3S32_10040 [Acidimicrobiia bacterium]
MHNRFHHLIPLLITVANKEAILDGMTDHIMAEIEEELGSFGSPSDGAGWKTALRHRILTARHVMLPHPWHRVFSRPVTR